MKWMQGVSTIKERFDGRKNGSYFLQGCLQVSCVRRQAEGAMREKNMKIGQHAKS